MCVYIPAHIYIIEQVRTAGRRDAEPGHEGDRKPVHLHHPRRQPVVAAGHDQDLAIGGRREQPPELVSGGLAGLAAHEPAPPAPHGGGVRREDEALDGGARGSEAEEEEEERGAAAAEACHGLVCLGVHLLTGGLIGRACVVSERASWELVEASIRIEPAISYIEAGFYQSERSTDAFNTLPGVQRRQRRSASARVNR